MTKYLKILHFGAHIAFNATTFVYLNTSLDEQFRSKSMKNVFSIVGKVKIGTNYHQKDRGILLHNKKIYKKRKICLYFHFWVIMCNIIDRRGNICNNMAWRGEKKLMRACDANLIINLAWPNDQHRAFKPWRALT